MHIRRTFTRNTKMSDRARRRTHKKSRTGCQACKQRHVRCDERRPSCSSCDKRRVPCLYPSPNHDHLITWELPYRHLDFSEYDEEVNGGDPAEHTTNVSDRVFDLQSTGHGEALPKPSTASLDPFSGYSVALTDDKGELLSFCQLHPF